MTGEKPDADTHYFSVLVSDERAEYVFATGANPSGLDSDRIQMLIDLYGKPTGIQEWASLALTRLGDYTYIEHVKATDFSYGNSEQDFQDAVADERGILDHLAQNR